MVTTPQKRRLSLRSIGSFSTGSTTTSTSGSSNPDTTLSSSPYYIIKPKHLPSSSSCAYSDHCYDTCEGSSTSTSSSGFDSDGSLDESFNSHSSSLATSSSSAAAAAAAPPFCKHQRARGRGSVTDCNKKKHATHFFDCSAAVPWLCTATAALLLHGSGLRYGVWRYRDGSWTELVLAGWGSVAEGTLLLLVLQRLALWSLDAPRQWWQQKQRRRRRRVPHQQPPSVEQQPPGHWLLPRRALRWVWNAGRTLVPFAAFVSLTIFLMSSIMGDTYYRAETGGLAPEIWVLAAFFLNARQYIQAKLVMAAENAAKNSGSDVLVVESSESATAAVEANTDESDAAAADGNNEEDEIAKCMVLCYFGAIALYLLGQLYQWWRRRKQQQLQRSLLPEHYDDDDDKKEQQHIYGSTSTSTTTAVDCTNNRLLALVLGLTLALYTFSNAWIPVTHAMLCFFGGFVFKPGSQYGFDHVTKPISTPHSNDGAPRPNVIYLLHDSLSGSILEKTPEGRKATPFFQSLIEQDDDFYLLPHSRSLSGDTRDGLTSLLSGCLPFSEAGRRLSYERSLGTEFRKRGYRTFAASSATLNFDKTAWFMMQNHIAGNMDKTVDPLSTGLQSVNIEGCDDRDLLPYLFDWLKETDDSKQPFYAQMYTFNQHYPYLVDPNATAGTNRYFSALESFDSLLKTTFDKLKETGQLDNTIIVGTADHGEHPDPQEYMRLKRFNSNVMHTASYMYVPRKLLDQAERERLRHNANQTVSLLDFYPTLQHILYGGDAESTQKLRARHRAADVTGSDQKHCVTGIDLLGATVADDRLAVQWNKISQPQSGNKGFFLGAVSGKETGLYVKGTGQWTEDTFQAWELDYGECSSVWDADCAVKLTAERRAHWLKTLNKNEFSDSLMLSQQMRDSRFMETLRKTLQATKPPTPSLSFTSPSSSSSTVAVSK